VEFRILGPLEVLDEGGPVELGGTKKRATLGYLLTNVNRVAAVSDLIRVLWSEGDAPISARKIIQNAVWGLRQTLTSDSAGASVALETQPPGYKLSIDPDSIDYHRFLAMAARGRESLAAGDLASAAQVLRRALALWRGPALADLAETGIVWPELSAFQGRRLDVLEDLFEAELALGRHQAVLGELEQMIEETGLRERAHAQLMVALYRSGRQAEALNVYSRVRATLIEELGLEPGYDLQALQRAILRQDPALSLADGPPSRLTKLGPSVASAGSPSSRFKGERFAPISLASRPLEPATGPSSRRGLAEPFDTASRAGSTAIDEGIGPGCAGAGAPMRRTGIVTIMPLNRQRQVSVLLLRSYLEVEKLEGDPGWADEHLEGVSRWIREEIEMFGGTVTATIGSISMAVFEAGDEPGQHARRAVMAASSICHGLRPTSFPAVGRHRTPHELSPRAAIVTGSALVQYEADDQRRPIAVTGGVLERCDLLLRRAGTREIRVCAETWARTKLLVAYVRATSGVDSHPEEDWIVKDQGPRPLVGARVRAEAGWSPQAWCTESNDLTTRRSGGP